MWGANIVLGAVALVLLVLNHRRPPSTRSTRRTTWPGSPPPPPAGGDDAQGARGPLRPPRARSVPATALLAAIAGLQNGAVVLPGLDQELDEESWDAIGVSEHEPAGAGHPQYGLKLLLERIGVQREAVVPLAQAAATLAIARSFRIRSDAPGEHRGALERAPGVCSAGEKARPLGRVGIDRGGERARGGARGRRAASREAVETPGRVAALVTPDRGLARRVAVELKRWGIDVDDSAGRPLGRTPPGVLARLVAETALGGAQRRRCSRSLKHPLAAFGARPCETRRAARSLERAVLRGPRLKPGLAALRHALELRFAERLVRAEGRAAATAPKPRDTSRSSDGRRRAELAERDRGGARAARALARSRTSRRASPISSRRISRR